MISGYQIVRSDFLQILSGHVIASKSNHWLKISTVNQSGISIKSCDKTGGENTTGKIYSIQKAGILQKRKIEDHKILLKGWKQ